MNITQESNSPTIKTAEERKTFAVRNLISRELNQLFLSYQNYTASEHLASIRRSKNNSDHKDPYFWNDEELLKAIEKHKEELDEEASRTKDEYVHNIPYAEPFTNYKKRIILRGNGKTS